jgi:hypothetical protein
MVIFGMGVAIHAHRSAREADRRDPDRVKRIISELNKKSEVH